MTIDKFFEILWLFLVSFAGGVVGYGMILLIVIIIRRVRDIWEEK